MISQKELTEELVQASKDYYNNGQSNLSDIEFDRKIETLRQMEKESGVVFPNSPTQNVGVKVDGLKTVKHEYPALSLDKVKYKNREDLIKWLGDHEGILSWKLDGSTIVATYDAGHLTQVVTRGNGEEGSDITHNARFFKGLPTTIDYNGHLVVRGEAMMTTTEFERVNEMSGGVYENARNLATATIQMLDPTESSQREIIFKAFKMVYPPARSPYETKENDRFHTLQQLGFDVVEHWAVVANPDGKDGHLGLLEQIEKVKEQISTLDYPTDGLVLSYDDQVYADSLGMTGHHPRGSVAMKWTDETEETTFRGVEWSVGKTGVITPVAEFDTVRLGIGSDVKRASMHNISIMKRLNPHIGGKISVYLANMIIPQIEAAWGEGDDIVIPTKCPICNHPTEISTDEKSSVQTLNCNNPDCPARVRNYLENAFNKDGLFIKGLGPRQIEDLQEVRLLARHPVSVFTNFKDASDPSHTELYRKYEMLMAKDGWGEKSWQNLLSAIETARNTNLQHFLYSLNIPLLGKDLSKKLSKFWNGNIQAFVDFVHSATNKDAALETLTNIEGIGSEKAGNIVDWCDDLLHDEIKYGQFINLVDALHFEEPESTGEQTLDGLTFVITGAVHVYNNRDEFKASVEARGGKVSGSVSSKTSFLVNNDVNSTSGKNKKAKELGIEIISEDEFINRYGK